MLALAIIAALAVAAGACSSASSSGAKTPPHEANTRAAVAPAKVAPVDTPAPTSTREVLKPHDTRPGYWNIVAYTFISPTEGWLIRTNTLWAGGRSPAQILHTSDGGDTWTVQYETSDFSPVSITMLDDQHGWVGGGTGDHCLDPRGDRPACTVAILTTADGGRTWAGPSVQVPGVTGDTSVEGSPAGWAVAGRATGSAGNTRMDVFTVRQDGAVWDDVLTEGRGLLTDFALAASDASHAVVITGATQYVTADGGVTWQDSTSPCSQDALGLRTGYVMASFALSPSNVWLLCMSSLTSGTSELRTLVHTADGGATWEVLGQAGTTLPGTGKVSANDIAPSLDFLDPMHGWYASGGPERGVYRTSDGGHTWQSVQAPAPHVTDVQFVDPDHGWVAMGVGAYTSQLARTTDGGAHWTVLPLP